MGFYSDSEIDYTFDCQKCAKWILDNDFKRPCLQFPDELLKYASAVSAKIQELSNIRNYVLADSTYCSCCVDFKSSLHITGDSIIHFGNACLSSSSEQIPVLYIFTNQKFDFSSLKKTVEDNFQKDSKILIMPDFVYQKECEKFYKEYLESNHPNSYLSTPILPERNKDNENENEKDEENSKSKNILNNRTLPEEEESLESYQVLYIGESNFLLNLLLLLPKLNFVIFNPTTGESNERSMDISKFLRKRNYYIERLKDSSSVGILVGTLAAEKYLRIIKKLKGLLKNAGKTVYVVSIGEINAAKLANFPDIEIFVLISCPESLIFDSKEFFQPIVTPYEVELAYEKNFSNWEEYVTDFRTFLKKGECESNTEIEEAEESSKTSTKRINPSFTVWAGLTDEPSENIKAVYEGKSGIAEAYLNEPLSNNDCACNSSK